MSWPAARRWIGIGLANVVLWSLLSIATYHAWVHGADHRDFYPRWAGARLLLYERRDLYSEDTTRQMQVMLYGAPLPPTSDQQGFAYPAQLVILLLPFWFISNVEVATAAWEGFSILIMLWTLLMLRQVRGVPAGVAAGLLLWHYLLLMVFQAQVVAIPMAALGIGLWAYMTRHDVLTGAVMGLGLIKPELAIVPLIVMLAVAILGRRWIVLKAFALAQVVVFGASFILAGWWVPEWLDAVKRYSIYAQTVWPVRVTFGISPLLGLGLLGFLGATLAWGKWDQWSVVAASIPLGMLLLPQTLNWGLTMLLVPLVLCWKGEARWAVIGVWLLGWAWLIVAVARPDWWRVQSLVMPLLTLAVVGISSRQSKEIPG